MVSKRGTPLGFVAASFNLNSITYVLQRDFYSLKIKYMLVFSLALLLATLSGPSSAIAMIPRLQFWRVNDVWAGNGDVTFRVMIGSAAETLYPETLTAQNTPARCFQKNASLLLDCPSYGMRGFLMREGISKVGLEGFINSGLNMTIQEEDWSRRSESSSVWYLPEYH